MLNYTILIGTGTFQLLSKITCVFFFLPKEGNVLLNERMDNWKYDRITEDNKNKCNFKRSKIISDLYINNEAT